MAKIDLLVWADGTAHAECYFSESLDRWIFVDPVDMVVSTTDEWIEVTLYLEKYTTRLYNWADDGLNQYCIACDLEAPGGIWVVTSDDYPELVRTYGEALLVVRFGLADGKVISGDEAVHMAETVLHEGR